jgi:hypothetical protein
VHGVEVKIAPDVAGYDEVAVYDPAGHFPADEAVFSFSGNPVVGPDHADFLCSY